MNDLLSNELPALSVAASGTTPDTRATLEQHPSLLQQKSVVLNLAYQEYCARRDAGESLDLNEFCARFPARRSSLRHRLSVDQFVFNVQEMIAQNDKAIWPEAGEVLGDYTLLREIGKGTFARVYLATEAATGDRPVVLKLSLDENTEAKTLGRLTHEHIVPVLSATRHVSGFSMLCMPYLGSATLHDVLDRAYPEPTSRPPLQARLILDAARATALPGDPVPELGEPAAHLQHGTWIEGVARVGERLALALAFVHKQGILHRDIKPSNVLLSTAGQPMLLDFNLSEDKRLDGTRNGGTLPYMAPEQLRFFQPAGDDQPPLDGRADLFALGVILYELLTGQHPFGQLPLKLSPAEMAALLLERQQQGCLPLRKFNPQVDYRLAKLIESCLAFAANDRPKNAVVLATQLQRWLQPSRGRRFVSLAAAALLFVFVGGAVAVPVFASQYSSRTTLAAVEMEAEYKQGCTAYESRNYAEANDHFERALSVDNNNVRNLFARGRAFLALGDKESACTYLSKANEKRPQDGRILAELAYSEARLGMLDGLAEFHTKQAEKTGFAPWELQANAVGALVRLGKLPEAEARLRKALAAEPTNIPSHYYYALIEYMKWLNRNGYKRPGDVPPIQTIASIEFVLKQYGNNAEAQELAALLCAAQANSPDSSFRQLGRNHLRQAILLGSSKKSLLNDTLTVERLGRAECVALFESLPEMESVDGPLLRELFLADPFPHWLDK